MRIHGHGTEDIKKGERFMTTLASMYKDTGLASASRRGMCSGSLRYMGTVKYLAHFDGCV